MILITKTPRAIRNRVAAAAPILRIEYFSVWTATAFFCLLLSTAMAFQPYQSSRPGQRRPPCTLASADGSWNGDVVPGETIQGCQLTPVDGSLTEFTISIDGIEADLGRFSQAIFKKLLMDAKQQRFQGFRPGTIPPHLEPTYRTYAMDECARETVLEAMQQNSIRPFENCRSELELGDFCIPPVAAKKKKKKKRKAAAATESEEENAAPEPAWRTFGTMKEAIDAGWKPGQSFSFTARKVVGQKVKSESETAGATPLVKEGFNF